jgi:4-diphosphocytidyl-2-C-methyl-D-erythritol kinase
LADTGPIEETARAKVNLALHVLGRRPDSYHLLDSIVVFADLCDRLSFSIAAANSLVLSGPCASGLDEADNLIWRAHAAMVKAFGRLIPNIAVRLDKQVPLASGLGGGSADAAATLRALCRLANLDSLSRAVKEIAFTLGADVPVCLYSRPCRMRGIGELIEPLPAFSPMHVIIANAGLPVSTAEVFQALGLAPGEPGYPPIELPFAFETSRNDLTPPAVKRSPMIGAVRDALKAQTGARFARMSGSGGSCFAVFDTPAEAETAAAELASRHPDWWVKPALLS